LNAHDWHHQQDKYVLSNAAEILSHKRHHPDWFVAVTFLLCLATPGTTNADGFSLSGKVLLDGPRPDRSFIPLLEKDGNLSDCSTLHDEEPRSEVLLVNENHEIANVFVYVRKGLPGRKHPVPNVAAILNQSACMFRPRVQGVMLGQELIMRNSDPVLHNVRALSFRNRPFNIGQPAQSPDRSKSFRRKEKAVMIQCDLHPWMQAHVFVMDHPYFAVTDSSGHFSIPDVPPGEYTLTAWHEILGEQDIEITIASDKADSAQFSFKPATPKRVMQGKLAATSPEATQPTTDPEAAQRTFVRKWDLTDLEADAENLDQRSSAKGAALFKAAGCIKCHITAGQGTKLGPELTDVTKRFKGVKLLEQILKPSVEINKDFKTQLFLTVAGKTVSGLVIEENETQIRLLPNPLKPRDIFVLKTAEIDERRDSSVSTMPESLLDTFSREEILDLLAFLQAGGRVEQDSATEP
jgi:putative heme-binding domain-containing protein